MRHYELVIVIDANLAAKDMKEVSGKVEKFLWKGILDTDDIGLMQTKYQIEGQDQAYYISYYVELDPDSIPQLKLDLSILKWIAKFTLFGMKESEAFLKMSDLKKRYEDMQPEEVEEEKKVEEEAIKQE